MLLYLLRHGQSEGNRLGIFQGRLDYPLSAEGVRQAKRAAEFLRDLKIEAIYTSPQKRALQTTEIVSEVLKVPLKVEESLREISYGILEGKTHKEVENRKEYRLWLEDPINNPLEGVDDLVEVQRRVSAFIEKLSEERALLITHGGIIRIILCTVGGIPLSRMWSFSVGNCSLSEVELKQKSPPKGKIKLVNLPTDGSVP